MLGPVGRMAAQQFATQVQKGRYVMYGARMLLHPFQTIIFAIMLIILSVYIAKKTSYKKSFGFLSFLLIAGTIMFTGLKFVPNPYWVGTKPAVMIMSIIEEIENATGMSADSILMQIASGATHIASEPAALIAQPVSYERPVPIAQPVSYERPVPIASIPPN